MREMPLVVESEIDGDRFGLREYTAEVAGVGVPHRPAPRDAELKMASTISGTVITAGDSCACSWTR